MVCCLSCIATAPTTSPLPPPPLTAQTPILQAATRTTPTAEPVAMPVRPLASTPIAAASTPVSATHLRHRGRSGRMLLSSGSACCRHASCPGCAQSFLQQQRQPAATTSSSEQTAAALTAHRPAAEGFVRSNKQLVAATHHVQVTRNHSCR